MSRELRGERRLTPPPPLPGLVSPCLCFGATLIPERIKVKNDELFLNKPDSHFPNAIGANNINLGGKRHVVARIIALIPPSLLRRRARPC